MSLKATIVCNFIVVLILLLIGIYLASLKNNGFQHEIRFDDTCTHHVACSFDLNIIDDYKGPFYIYFQYHNYFLNHRAISKSFDSKQLKGDDRTVKELGDFCENKATNAEGGRTTSYTGQALVSTAALNPCG